MGHDQRIVFFPPGEVPAFAAKKAHHLQQIINLGWPQRRLKGRHDTASLGDKFPNLIVAFSLHGVPKIRRLHRQVSCGWTITTAAWAMTTVATLRVKRVHSFIAPAGSAKHQQNEGAF